MVNVGLNIPYMDAIGQGAATQISKKNHVQPGTETVDATIFFWSVLEATFWFQVVIRLNHQQKNTSVQRCAPRLREHTLNFWTRKTLWKETTFDGFIIATKDQFHPVLIERWINTSTKQTPNKKHTAQISHTKSYQIVVKTATLKVQDQTNGLSDDPGN